ncbi:capsular biosynthesis protein [Pradoshia eiseniae]|uniref:Capsular biosynthesis protein n=1 Tax=Pradoshia eiseniae TaxID=2064768 RepID=A0A2S7MXK4_9BACI|nr:CapA family protein [Pradoshia eiseniae]PQD94485.1 capsular biosynthesis protein [Pradoshia eiseniae]
MKKNTIILIAFLLISAGAIGAAVFLGQQDETASTIPLESTVLAERPLALSSKTYKQTITIGAIGDILIHTRVYEDARTDDSYDFKRMLAPVKKMLEEPDFTIANQESLAGGSKLGLSGYPAFNSPYEITDALVDAGIDLVTLANNHSLDKGEKGIQSSLAYYDKIGMPYVGMHKDELDASTERILSIQGIKVGFLSYTYGTNGIQVPDGKDYLVNYLEDKKIISDLKSMRDKADIILVNAHWGNEYERTPSEEQRRLAKLMAENGADVIIGHHPHVLQPIEWLKHDNGETLVVYSLGNFLSGQVRDYKDIGGMVTVEIEKTWNEKGSKTSVLNPSFSPTYMVSSNEKNYEVRPFEEATVFGSPETDLDELSDFMLEAVEQ